MSRSEIGGNGGPPLIPSLSEREGWVAIARSMRGHWLVGFGQTVKPCDPTKDYCMSRAEAWIDLIMECRYDGGFVNNGGHKMYLKPGQLLGATSWLASRWNWSPKTVRGFIEKLEAEGMIETRTNQGESEKGKHQGKHQGKQARVLSICNYDRYQVLPAHQGQALGQGEGKQRASRGQAEGHNIRITTEQGNKEGLPPTPPDGGSFDLVIQDEVGANSKPSRAKAKQFRVHEIELTNKARESWNETAAELGLVKCQAELSPTRRRRLLQRLEEIGGLDQFHIALGAIQHVPFLCGKVKPKDGGEPFRLDIDRLMQTSGNLGDVLAKLIDKAGDVRGGGSQPSRPWWRDPATVSGISDEEWRKRIANHANGIWPVDELSPPPGHNECRVPKHIIDDLGLDLIYDVTGIRRKGAGNGHGMD